MLVRLHCFSQMSKMLFKNIYILPLKIFAFFRIPNVELIEKLLFLCSPARLIEFNHYLFPIFMLEH